MSSPGQLVEDPAAVARAELPVGARVVTERRSRPEVQLGQVAVVEADGVGEVVALAVGVEDRGDLPVRDAVRGCSREWSWGTPLSPGPAERRGRSPWRLGAAGGWPAAGPPGAAPTRGHRALSLTRLACTWMRNSSLVSRRQPTTIPSARRPLGLEEAPDEVAQPLGRVAVLLVSVEGQAATVVGRHPPAGERRLTVAAGRRTKGGEVADLRRC